MEQAEALSAAFDYFNKKLFQQELSPCFLSFTPKKNTHGFFKANAWQMSDGSAVVHEISLNPESLGRPLPEAFSTLVHEMCHLWQEEHGTEKAKPGYHDKEWGAKMESVGLMPSSDGSPDGKKTGKKMTHYLMEDGLFLECLDSLPEEVSIPWIAVFTAQPDGEKEKSPKAKIKYPPPCGERGCTVWGGKELDIICGKCKQKFEPEAGADLGPDEPSDPDEPTSSGW